MSKYNFKNLVFEGGGVKGMAMEALLLCWMIKIFFPHWAGGRYIGRSNYAALLPLGYTSAEVGGIISHTNFKDFEDSGFLFDALLFTRKYGWYKGGKFRDWIGDMVKAKTGNKEYTFGDLANNVQAKGFKQLFVIGTNLSQQQACIFSHETTPTVAMRNAVLMSMSISLYFQSVLKNAHMWVDGRVSWNYPVNIFDNERYISKADNSEKATYNTDPGFVFNYETLGFRLDSTKVIEYNKDNWACEPVDIKNIKDYALGLVNFMMEMTNKKRLHQNDWSRTVFIDTLDIKTTDFKLGNDKINALVQSGRTGVTDYFSWRDADLRWGRLPV